MTRYSSRKSMTTPPATTCSSSAIPTSGRTYSSARLPSWPSTSSRRLAVLLLLCGCRFFAAAQEPYSQLRATGPLTLAIAYRCNPDQRTVLRRKMLEGGVDRFEAWKKQGVLQTYHILFNSYLDSETYDMLALLSFNTYR